jgi:hypothetical protein
LKVNDVSEEYNAYIFRVEELATCFHAGFLLGVVFDPKDGGDMVLRNVG